MYRNISHKSNPGNDFPGNDQCDFRFDLFFSFIFVLVLQYFFRFSFSFASYFLSFSFVPVLSNLLMKTC